MVNKRLTWWLENKRILNANQSGFRKKRRCMDNFINIEKRITEATNQGKNTVLVSFDLKKSLRSSEKKTHFRKFDP